MVNEPVARIWNRMVWSTLFRLTPWPTPMKNHAVIGLIAETRYGRTFGNMLYVGVGRVQADQLIPIFFGYSGATVREQSVNLLENRTQFVEPLISSVLDCRNGRFLSLCSSNIFSLIQDPWIFHRYFFAFGDK